MSREHRSYAAKFEIPFTWQVPSAGFRWATHPDRLRVGDNDPVYLMENNDENGLSLNTYTTQEPLKGMNHLFANFAEMPASDENFLKWANENGKLSRGEVLDFRDSGMVLLPANENWEQPVERREFWYSQHYELNAIFTIWKRIDESKKTSGNVAISEYFVWEEAIDTPCRFVYYPEGEDSKKQGINKQRFFVNATGKRGGGLVLFSHRDNDWEDTVKSHPYWQETARRYVKKEIDKKLRGVFSPLLSPGKKIIARITPPDLLTAMWVQFYFLVNDYLTLKRCDICKKWEDMSFHHVDWTQHEKCGIQKRLRDFWREHKNRSTEE